MNRVIHIENIEGEKAGGVVNVSTYGEDENAIFVQITKHASPMESAFIYISPDEAQQVIEALSAALSKIQEK